MATNKYVLLLILFLVFMQVTIFCGQFEYYLKLQPALNASEDSIAIPLLGWLVFLIIESLILLAIQIVVSQRLSSSSIKNNLHMLYLGKHKHKWTIIITIMLIIFFHLYLWFSEMFEVGILYLGFIYSIIALAYFILMANYFLNLNSEKTND